MKRKKGHRRGEPCDHTPNNIACGLQLNESGVVLVALLWIFIALSAIVLSFDRKSRVEVAAIRNSQSMEKAYYIYSNSNLDPVPANLFHNPWDFLHFPPTQN
jgi:hypothetical protein